MLFATARRFAPALAPFEWNITVARYAVASAILIIALVVAHKWLPAGRRRFAEIAPGIVATLVLWLAGGMVFGRYLAEFPYIYVSYYAGLASVMIALVFLYLTASIFVFGGELNAAILRARIKPIERRRRRCPRNRCSRVRAPNVAVQSTAPRPVLHRTRAHDSIRGRRYAGVRGIHCGAGP